MDRLTNIEQFATDLIKEYAPNYSFKWSNGKRVHGYCDYRSKEIALSKFHALQHNDDEVLDTILHEIAHARCTFRDGHNYRWKQECIKIGAKPNRCHSIPLDIEHYKYKMVCDNNHEIKKYLRKPSIDLKYRYCPKCYNEGLGYRTGKLEVVRL